RFRIFLNGFGAVCTFIVMLILMVTKFAEGAWVVMVAIPILVFMYTRIHRHYAEVAASLTLDGIHPGPLREPRVDRGPGMVVVVLHCGMRFSVRVMEYAVRVIDIVRVCSIEVATQNVAAVQERWQKWGLTVPLDVVESPYRAIGKPLIQYLH